MVLKSPISADKGPVAYLDAAAVDGGALLVPGGDFLLHADYVRQGPDLVLVGQDGAEVLIVEFFAVAQPPVLQSESGLRILPEVAAKLAGPMAPGQFAQAAPAVAGEPVAKVETVDGEAVAIRADGTRVVLAAGSPIFEGDVLETGVGAALGLIYIDGMTMALDQNTRMIIDQVFYNAAANQGKALFSLVEGAFLSLSGEIAKLGEDVVQFQTPTGTIGIRGTNLAASHIGVTQVVLLPNLDGTVSALIFYNDGGFTILDQAFAGLLSTSFSDAPSQSTVFGSVAEAFASLGITGRAADIFDQTVTENLASQAAAPDGDAPNDAPDFQAFVIVEPTDLGAGLGTDVFVAGGDDLLAGSGAIIFPKVLPSPSTSPLPPPAIKPPVLIFEGFEAGIDPMDTFTIGSVGVVGPGFGIAPPEGGLQALLSPAPAFATVTEIEAFFDLPAGALAIITDGVPTKGAAIKTVLDLDPGDTVTVTFSFNFLDIELPPVTPDALAPPVAAAAVILGVPVLPGQVPDSNDFAFAVIGDDLILLASADDSSMGMIVTDIGVAATSGYVEFTFAAAFPSGGTVDLGVGVANVDNALLGSALLLDDVSILIEAAA